MSIVRGRRIDNLKTTNENSVWRCYFSIEGYSYSFVRKGEKGVACSSEPRIGAGLYRNNLKRDAYAVAAIELKKFLGDSEAQHVRVLHEKPLQLNPQQLKLY